jgi:hypothetical protein
MANGEWRMARKEKRLNQVGLSDGLAQFYRGMRESFKINLLKK